ncbi:hypothetical protein AAMO2058_001204900 [Amorphochlora amoebiformis]
MDSNGNIWVADMVNHKIRKIIPPGHPEAFPEDSMIFTMAGNLTAGYRDGPARRATLFTPMGIACHPNGAVYFTEPFRHQIRRFIPPKKKKILFPPRGPFIDAPDEGLEPTWRGYEEAQWFDSDPCPVDPNMFFDHHGPNPLEPDKPPCICHKRKTVLREKDYKDPDDPTGRSYRPFKPGFGGKKIWRNIQSDTSFSSDEGYESTSSMGDYKDPFWGETPTFAPSGGPESYFYNAEKPQMGWQNTEEIGAEEHQLVDKLGIGKHSIQFGDGKEYKPQDKSSDVGEDETLERHKDLSTVYREQQQNEKTKDPIGDLLQNAQMEAIKSKQEGPAQEKDSKQGVHEWELSEEDSQGQVNYVSDHSADETVQSTEHEIVEHEIETVQKPEILPDEHLKMKEILTPAGVEELAARKKQEDALERLLAQRQQEEKSPDGSDEKKTRSKPPRPSR